MANLFGGSSLSALALTPSKPNTASTGGLFGGGQPALQKTTGGLFGGGDGATQGNQGKATSLFGGGAPAAVGGNAPSTGGLFGGGATGAGNVPSAGGLFGGQPQTNTGVQGQAGATGGGGLFGGGANNNQNNQGAGTGLGLQRQNTPGFGALGATSTSQGGGLLGAPSTGGLFGGNQQPNNNAAQGGGLFGGAQQNKQSTGGLFGGLGGQQQQNQQPSGFGGIGGLGGLGGQGGGLQQQQNLQLGQMNQQFNPNVYMDVMKTFISPQYSEIRKQYEKQEQEKEIFNMFQNYEAMLGVEPNSQQNRFQQVFYNQFPDNSKNMQRNQVATLKKILKDHVPKHVLVQKQLKVENAQPQDQQTRLVQYHAPTNLDLWIKSYDANPDNTKFYTVQINSTEDLLLRAQKICGNQENKDGELDKALKRIELLVKQLREACERQGHDQQEQLDICKYKNTIIQKSLLRIFGKFEKLAHLEGKVDMCHTNSVESRDLLIQKQKQLLYKISQNYRGQTNQGSLISKLEHISTQNRQVQKVNQENEEVKENPSSEQIASENLLQKEQLQQNDISEEDFTDMFKVLKKQKEGIDVLCNSINESTRQCMIMEREVDLIQRNNQQQENSKIRH